MALFDTFRVQVDWDKDLSFGHSEATLDHVIRVDYDYGLSVPFVEVGDPSQMVIHLDNTDGTWFVENSSSPLYGVFRKGCLVRVQEFQSGSWRTLFSGNLLALEAEPRENPPFRARLMVGDPFPELEAAEYTPPLQLDVTPDAAIRMLFELGTVIHPYPNLYWLVGIVGSSEVGTSTTLFEQTAFPVGDVGKTTLAFVGDNADEGFGVSALGFIRDCVAAEAGGRFLFNPKAHANDFGVFEFWNRHHLPAIVPTIDISDQVLDNPPPVYRYGDDVINHVEVNYEPRSVGTPGSILYQAPNPISVQAGEARIFNAFYRDPDVESARVGGMDMIDPIPGTDWIANSEDDGSGTDLTAQVALFADFKGGQAAITILNSAAVTVYITLLRLKGTPITAYARETYVDFDGESIANHGLHKRTLNLNFVDDLELIRNFTGSLLRRFASPQGRLEQVTLRNASLTQQTSLLGLGVICDLDDLENAETDYVVVGVRHSIDQASGDNLLTLILEPLSRQIYWLLQVTGRSELDQTTILGF